MVDPKVENKNKFHIKYLKSFLAKLIQSSDETKGYYSELKNYALSYQKTGVESNWDFESITAGRNCFIKFGVRGKTLVVYYPLNADDYASSKYKVEKLKSRRYVVAPCMYRINNKRRVKYAKELIDVVAKKLKLEKGELPHNDYYLPYENTEVLQKKKLIK